VPSTRTIIRKNEAAGAAALFSNSEIINITAENQDDVMGVAGAAAIKEVLEYRLDRTIKTFPLVMGALQDAQRLARLFPTNTGNTARRTARRSTGLVLN
jgi:hypothetical protein